MDLTKTSPSTDTNFGKALAKFETVAQSVIIQNTLKDALAKPKVASEIAELAHLTGWGLDDIIDVWEQYDCVVAESTRTLALREYEHFMLGGESSSE